MGILKLVKAFGACIRSWIGWHCYYRSERYIFQVIIDECVFDEQNFVPKVDVDVRIIHEKETVCDLLRDGFTINPPFALDMLETLPGQVLLCLFVERDLAHWQWLALDETAKIYPPLKIDYETDAYQWRGLTAPKYRGLGLYHYAILNLFKYAKEIGKSRIVFTALKDNYLVLRAWAKLGGKVCGELYYLRIFAWTFWQTPKRNAYFFAEEGREIVIDQSRT